MDMAGARVASETVQHGAPPPMWMICGDFNIKLGSLLYLKTDYENSNDPMAYRIQIHVGRMGLVDQGGDIMLSQGFSTVHVASSIGPDDPSGIQHCTVVHRLVTLLGHRLPSAPATARRIAIEIPGPPTNPRPEPCPEPCSATARAKSRPFKARPSRQNTSAALRATGEQERLHQLVAALALRWIILVHTTGSLEPFSDA